ncbi:MAG: hypothetical protein ACRC6L_11055 [Steroidobacteraceae bacterium]
MSIKTCALSALAGLCFAFVATVGSVQAANRCYAEGTVSVVSSIRTEPGQNDAYMRYLVTTYKNLAAMDGLQDRTEAIQERLLGNQEARDAATIARGKMRTAVGNEVIREVVFK